MSKIIRLTEKDLTKIVNRIISEQLKHGTGVIMNEPEKKELVNKDMLFPVLRKLDYRQGLSNSEGGWTKKIPQKNKILIVRFNNNDAVVETKNIKQPTQTGSDGKIRGMGLSKPLKKFPLLLKKNTLKEFENFLLGCE
jgi:hypothetical protein